MFIKFLFFLLFVFFKLDTGNSCVKTEVTVINEVPNNIEINKSDICLELNNLNYFPKVLNNIISDYASFDFEKVQHEEFIKKLNSQDDNQKIFNRHNIEFLKKILPEIRAIRKNIQSFADYNFQVLIDFINLETEVCYRIENLKNNMRLDSVDKDIELFRLDYKDSDDSLEGFFYENQNYYDLNIYKRLKRFLIFLLIKRPNYVRLYNLFRYYKQIRLDRQNIDSETINVNLLMENFNVKDSRKCFIERNKIYFE